MPLIGGKCPHNRFLLVGWDKTIIMKKEVKPLLLFLSALIVFGTLSVFGMVYNLGKSIYECFRGNIFTGICKFIYYWLKVLYQLWNVVKYFLMKSAIAIDLFGNVAGGELVEDCVTAKEDTLFGKGSVTMSAGVGELEIEDELNPRGLFLTNLLSKALGKNHSVEAYEKYINEKES